MTKTFSGIDRKLVHVSGLAFLTLLSSYPFWVSITLVVVTAIYLTIELLRMRGIQVGFLSDRIEKLKRPTEKGKIDWAAPLLGLGIILSVSFFSYPVTACALIQVCLSDTAAALVGERWGKTKIFYSSRKSYLGSLAFFMTALLACLFYIPFWISLPLALIGTVLESFPLRHWDNFLIPLGVSFSASLLLWP